MPGLITYQSLFGVTAPSTDSGERVPLVLGVQVRIAVAGRLVGVRWYRDDGDSGQHWGILRSADNVTLERVTVFRQNAAGAFGANRWINAYFHPIKRVTAGELVIVDVFSELGYWHYTPGLYAADYVSGDLTAPHRVAGMFAQGLFSYASDLTTQGDGAGSAYGVDLLFLAG